MEGSHLGDVTCLNNAKSSPVEDCKKILLQGFNTFNWLFAAYKGILNVKLHLCVVIMGVRYMYMQ